MIDAYRKLIAAVIGLAVLLAHRHLGIDLTAQSQMLVDVVISVLTALGVWAVPNTQTNT